MSETESMEIDPHEGPSKEKQEIPKKKKSGYEMPWYVLYDFHNTLLLQAFLYYHSDSPARSSVILSPPRPPFTNFPITEYI